VFVVALQMVNLLGLGLFVLSHNSNSSSHKTPINLNSQSHHHQLSVNMGKGKPAGLNAARKLRIHRRENRWADEHFRKRALGTAWKSSPLKGASHGKGIVLEKIGIEAKQPNSAVRKCVRVQLIKNGKK
jgi:hypothetical protein